MTTEALIKFSKSVETKFLQLYVVRDVLVLCAIYYAYYSLPKTGTRFLLLKLLLLG